MITKDGPAAVVPNPEADGFSHGGIYVPTAQGGAFGHDSAAAIADAANIGGPRDKALADAYLPQRASTPTELSRNIMSRWLQAAPGTEERRLPFIVTRGPPALARAVRALAFVSNDLSKARHEARGVLKMVVEPLFWTREAAAPVNGRDQRGASRFVVLRLVPAPNQNKEL